MCFFIKWENQYMCLGIACSTVALLLSGRKGFRSLIYARSGSVAAS